MATTKKEESVVKEVTTGEVVEENTSSKNICLTSGILHPGDMGVATRAELGTLWQFLELAEK